MKLSNAFASFVLSLFLGCTAWGEVEVYFTPQDNCTQVLVDAIDSAKESVYVQAYHLSDRKIGEALSRAAQGRNLTVFILIDWVGGHQKTTMIHFLAERDVLVRLDKQPKGGIAHNKVIIIDDEIVFTGSFNFTLSAQLRNAENLVKITDEPEIVDKYMDNFLLNLGDAKYYNPKSRPKRRPLKRAKGAVSYNPNEYDPYPEEEKIQGLTKEEKIQP